MLAVQITKFGGLECIVVQESDVPVPGPGEILVKVSAAGVNPVDWKIREGHMKDMLAFAFPTTLGSELAGTVVALGEGVTDLAPGDRVHGSTGALGAFAEFAVIARNAIAKIPDKLDFSEAAALPVGVLTATAAFKAGAVGRDTRLLIHAASGGVGTVAIQLAHALGAEVTALGSASNLDLLRSLGAHHAVDRTTSYETQIGDFDVVLDAFGPEAQARSWGLMRPGGILVSLVAPPDQGQAQAHGVRATMSFGVPESAALENADRLVEQGLLRPILHRTFPIAKAAEAIAEVEAGHVRGKNILLL
ncbi:MAG: hypothetical protein DI606_00475 [Sphingobium sp.]|uniref:NADP-dependent oxidoreductase n=1 Tax=Sphingobium sp. TaxID=1912891 RepID=UPI000DB1ED74|nr:NADP-dependent oxidoreductase [Sphingobium sp.]PZU15077.1 MAG: hypothetical protein DI606_00475 [Sphingobium sp.]